MYKCFATGKVSQPGEPCHKVVVATREKEYISPDIKGKEKSQYAQSIIDSASSVEDAKDLLERKNLRYKISEGFEIVKEVPLCTRAFEAYKAGRIEYKNGKFTKVEDL